jgi:hypothetical protein
LLVGDDLASIGRQAVDAAVSTVRKISSGMPVSPEMSLATSAGFWSAQASVSVRAASITARASARSVAKARAAR